MQRTLFRIFINCARVDGSRIEKGNWVCFESNGSNLMFDLCGDLSDHEEDTVDIIL